MLHKEKNKYVDGKKSEDGFYDLYNKRKCKNVFNCDSDKIKTDCDCYPLNDFLVVKHSFKYDDRGNEIESWAYDPEGVKYWQNE